MDEETLFRATHSDVVPLDEIALSAGQERLAQQIERRGRRWFSLRRPRMPFGFGLGTQAASAARAAPTPATEHPYLRIGIISVAAFAVAGALTGAAFASGATVSATQIAGEAAAKGAAEELLLHQQHGTVLGTPIARTGSYVAIQLKHRPNGANGDALGVTCLSTGSYVIEDSLGTRTVGECSAKDVGIATAQSGFESAQFLRKLDPVVIVSSKTGARLSVWVSWAHVPILRPSPSP